MKRCMLYLLAAVMALSCTACQSPTDPGKVENPTPPEKTVTFDSQKYDVVSSGLSYADGKVTYRYNGYSERFDANCPAFTIAGEVYSTDAPAVKVMADDRNVVLSYAIAEDGRTLDVMQYFSVSPADGAMRMSVKVLPKGFGEGQMLERIELMDLEVSAYGEYVSESYGNTLNSYPAYFPHFFAAIEHPVANNTWEEGAARFSHCPGTTVVNDQSFSSRSMLIGLSEQDDAKYRFEHYIDKNRPTEKKKQTNYNSWWSLPVSPDEEDVLNLLEQIQTNLYEPYGVAFDSFCMDLGWSKPDGVWELNAAKYTDGSLDRINGVIRSMGMTMGLWISPSNMYSPMSFDNFWAKENGFEVLPHPWLPGNYVMNIALGSKYQNALKSRLVEYIEAYGLGHIKFDGYWGSIDAATEGYPTGIYSMELLADGMIDVFRACSAANPDIWMETTCFGANASPFWLNHCSSVIGTFGDDAPPGYVPSFDYRESLITSRDNYNLNGSDRLASPVRFQEILGVIHQDSEDFTNDAVNVIMRGNTFLPFYVNPYAFESPTTPIMDRERWAKLAMLLRWFNKNVGQIRETEALRPESFRTGNEVHMASTLGENVYGYAHWAKESALVLLRNPSMERDRFTLKLPEFYGEQMYAVSQYPEARNYGKTSGGELEVELAPYETLVLDLEPDAPDSQIPAASESVGGKLSVSGDQNGSRLAGDTVKFDYRAAVDSSSDETYLYLQLQGGEDTLKMPQNLLFLVNGTIYKPTLIDSRDGWYSSGIVPSYFWQYAKVRLPRGKNDVQIKFTADKASVGEVALYAFAQKRSAFVYSDKNVLPPPEVIYEDSKLLCKVMPDVSYRVSLPALSGYGAEKMWDGDPESFYHSNNDAVTPSSPARIDIGYNKPQTVSTLEYLMRQDNGDNGAVLEAELYWSEDGKNYTLIDRAKWNTENPAERRTLNFEAVTAQYFRIVVTKTVNGYLSAAEIHLG